MKERKIDKKAFLFPGQGMQILEAGRNFYMHSLEARQIFQQADNLLHFSLTKMIVDRSSQLLQTRYNQLAVFVISAAILHALIQMAPHLSPHVCSGLSIGEYSGLYAAGKIDFPSCLHLIDMRGRLMQQSSDEFPGRLLVVVGLQNNLWNSIPSFCWCVNVYHAQNIIVASPLSCLNGVIAQLYAAGAKKVVPLPISGMFHTPFMSLAAQKMKPLIEMTKIRESNISLVMNLFGEVVCDERMIKFCLLHQIISTIYWEKCMKTMISDGVEIFYEIGSSYILSTYRENKAIKKKFCIKMMQDLLCLL